jgi:hypothetical protein
MANFATLIGIFQQLLGGHGDESSSIPQKSPASAAAPSRGEERDAGF